MSNPADNTEVCPVCGLAPHVHGCTPGKCGAPKPEPELPPGKWALTPRGARPALAPEPAPTTGEAANDNRSEHPLPWRWEESEDYLRLVAADGTSLIDHAGGILPGEGFVAVSSPYVRAVTERAGAMDRALRWAMSWLDDFVDFDDHESEQRMKATAARKLLAEIDAAKAGGLMAVIKQTLAPHPNHAGRVSLLWYQASVLIIAETTVGDPTPLVIEIPQGATHLEMIPMVGDRELCRRCGYQLLEWGCDRQECRARVEAGG